MDGELKTNLVTLESIRNDNSELHMFYRDADQIITDPFGLSKELNKEREIAKRNLIRLKNNSDFDIYSTLTEIAKSSFIREQQFYEIIPQLGKTYSQDLQSVFNRKIGGSEKEHKISYDYMQTEYKNSTYAKILTKAVYGIEDNNDSDAILQLLQALATITSDEIINQSESSISGRLVTTMLNQFDSLMTRFREEKEKELRRNLEAIEKELQKKENQGKAASMVRGKVMKEQGVLIQLNEKKIVDNIHKLLEVIKNSRKKIMLGEPEFTNAVITEVEQFTLEDEDVKNALKSMGVISEFRSQVFFNPSFKLSGNMGILSEWLTETLSILQSTVGNLRNDSGEPISSFITEDFIIDVISGIKIKQGSQMKGEIVTRAAAGTSKERKAAIESKLQELSKVIDQAAQKAKNSDNIKSLQDMFSGQQAYSEYVINVEESLKNDPEIVNCIGLIKDVISQFHDYCFKFLLSKGMSDQVLNKYKEIIPIVNTAIAQDGAKKIKQNNNRQLSSLNEEINKIPDMMSQITGWNLVIDLLEEESQNKKFDKKVAIAFVKAKVSDKDDQSSIIKVIEQSDPKDIIDNMKNKIRDKQNGFVALIQGAIGEVFFPSLVRSLLKGSNIDAEQLGSAWNLNEKQLHMDIKLAQKDKNGEIIKQWGVQSKIYSSNTVHFYRNTIIDFGNFNDKQGFFTAIKYMGSNEALAAIRFLILNHNTFDQPGINNVDNNDESTIKNALMERLDYLMRYGDGLSSFTENGIDVKNHFYMINFNIIPASAVILYIRDILPNLMKNEIIDITTLQKNYPTITEQDLAGAKDAKEINVLSERSKNVLPIGRALAKFKGISINFNNLGVLFNV